MARTSYGGDIFSPICSDLSLNDSAYKEEGRSGRGSISEDLNTISPVKSSKGINITDRRRKKDRTLPLEDVTLQHKNNKSGSKSTKENEETVSKSNLFPSSCVKDENISSSLTLRRSPRIARRSQKKDDEIAEKQTDSRDSSSLSSNKSVSSQKSKNKDKDSVRSFITFRGKESKKAERVGNRTKSCSVNALATQSEKLEAKEIKIADSTGNSYEIPVHDCLNEEIKGEVTETSVISDSLVSSNKNISLSPIKEKIDEVGLKTSSNRDTNESNRDYAGDILSSRPAGIQIKMIEKLSDTVTVQFDVIRQQMYQQQICFLKVLNETREEFEDRHYRDTENLHKIIEELMEENRLLRSAIIAQH